jgi:hypothetical protein
MIVEREIAGKSSEILPYESFASVRRLQIRDRVEGDNSALVPMLIRIVVEQVVG